MRLFIAEKPDLGRAIAAGIGGNWQNHKTHMTNGNDTISWCFGHMLELADPEDYDPKYKSWNLADLPFANLPVKYKIPSCKLSSQMPTHSHSSCPYTRIRCDQVFSYNMTGR